MIRMICDKLNLICRYCDMQAADRALAGMGDVNEALLKVIGELMEAKTRDTSLPFNEGVIVGSLQLAFDAMQKKELGSLASVLREGLIPELEHCELVLSRRTAANAQMSAGVRDADMYDPEEWAAGLAISAGPQTVCMFGYGSGSCYAALEARLAEGSTIIVYEPERDSITELKEQLQQYVDFYRLENLLVCVHPLYDTIFATERVDFIHAINENRERVLVNKNTLKRFKDTASRNVITNLHILKNMNLVSDLSGILPPEVPVIIVSAGPSLDKNIELLREAKGHSLIFAVDTAMKYLMQHDIMPDLGITVEPIKPMANYEDDRCFDVPHIFDCESNPEIVSRERGRIFIYNCRDYVKRLLEAAGKEVPSDTASGGSVATAAFAVCYQLGIRNIILIGQDLAYSGEATHAGGVESKGINNNIGHEMIDGIDGTKVRTRSDWLGYLHWFENSIVNIADMGIELNVIDATEGGALIHGTKVMTLAEAIAQYCAGCTYSFDEALKRLDYTLSDFEYKETERRIAASFDELDKVRETALNAAELCERMIAASEAGTASDVTERDALAELGRARRTCEEAMLYSLINNYAVSDIIEEVSRLRADTADPVSEFRQQKLAFDAIAQACGYFEILGAR